ncbi:hypothetical protein Sya03_47860 [Spirilliplanes yamanashiensis]|uniref:Uncharacterized protein n=1 Tax=Spirilliplanes yamanashiensis TaxID=42233 RepID=A0A8J3YC86_9ACTN|nr:hypothetical protein Sya03_47860 [Spirilliplanes yamanashiensis]
MARTTAENVSSPAFNYLVVASQRRTRMVDRDGEATWPPPGNPAPTWKEWPVRRFGKWLDDWTAFHFNPHFPASYRRPDER